MSEKTTDDEPFEQHTVSRRTLLKGGAAVAGLTVLQVAGPAQAFPGHAGEEEDSAGAADQPDLADAMAHGDAEVIPWLDQPAPNPVPANVGNLLVWEELDSWRIPSEDFFFVNHFGQPTGLDAATWGDYIILGKLYATGTAGLFGCSICTLRFF
ncbi:MAG: twin-arginine translocation signal domain-containing protein [Chloroflexota bacterium]|nr:twin-arginine translocation signal domain-containing protein [Chloroflexota bacterium]